MVLPDRLRQYVDAISASGLALYDPIDVGDAELWIPSAELEQILDLSLHGLSVEGLALRTRSKLVNQEICKALGYPVPKSFKRTKPRFPGQDFDKYTQKANNLQIWNDQISPTRRYVVIRISEDFVVTKVKVVSGDVLAFLDTTGTLTQKYQAQLNPRSAAAELVSQRDTENVENLLAADAMVDLGEINPVSLPTDSSFLPIGEVFGRLSGLLGSTFPDPGSDQERNRGGNLHKLACLALGYRGYADDGQFPDVRNQLTEVKLQTSPTIDLGLVKPDSTSPLDMPKIKRKQLRHCDVRYALFYGSIKNRTVYLEKLYVATGADFFGRFPQFGGKILNKKIQIPLPSGFFDS